VLLLSLLLVPASVHTYCENRPIAGLFGAVSLLVGFVLVLSTADTRTGRVVKIAGLILSVFAMTISAAFIVWATNTCRHMFDLLK
jgi:hypothetical protein